MKEESIREIDGIEKKIEMISGEMGVLQKEN
jgi:hypothetical protein